MTFLCSLCLPDSNPPAVCQRCGQRHNRRCFQMNRREKQRELTFLCSLCLPEINPPAGRQRRGQRHNRHCFQINRRGKQRELTILCSLCLPELNPPAGRQRRGQRQPPVVPCVPVAGVVGSGGQCVNRFPADQVRQVEISVSIGLVQVR